MCAWTVAETVNFLQAADLEGPAELFRQNGVNGNDLLELDEQCMVEDLRATRFAARKVTRARKNYLTSG